MEIESTYVHILDGRLRIKVAGVKGSPTGASRVGVHLHSLDGVLEAVANPLTGNVLVRYDPAKIRQAEIVRALEELGCLPYRPAIACGSQRRLAIRLAQAIAQAATEAAVQRALGALI